MASSDPASSSRINIRMVQSVLLIWLDSNIDDNDADCRNSLTQLHCVVNTIKTYTDSDQCLQFLQSIRDDKACMVISGSLGQQIVPRVHDIVQVDTIFIFCRNKKLHEQWVKKWPKIKGVFTEITPICEALKKTVQQCEQDAMSISFMTTSSDLSKKNLDQLEPSFMYTQILKEILLTMTFEQQHFQGFIQYCREALVDNNDELKILKKLEREYHDETPIWWYTCQCILYTMLNRALRLMDGGTIIQMGFFIGDLHRQIEQLHEEQFPVHQSSNVFTVYRGQGLSREDFEQMSNTNGGLISFNYFLSTSKNRNVSLRFARVAMTKPQTVGVLFVMTVDPTKSTAPFASITDVSYFKDSEDEVLFSMHTVFRIIDITPMDENSRLFQLTLSLASDDDNDLRLLTDRIREEIYPTDRGWYRLGLVLMQMGQFAKAQEVYEILLGQTTDEYEKGQIYDALGRAHDHQGCYQKAITFYKIALEILKKIVPPNHPTMASTYNNIGLAHYNMGDYAKALSWYEKDFEINTQTLPPNHPDLAVSYNNIGLVYRNMGDNPKALSYYEKALSIRQQSLPPNHPHLAVSYSSIGSLYDSMGDYAKALSCYEKALAIEQQSLPSNHPDLAVSYYNIGVVYGNMSDDAKSQWYYETAVNIGEQSLPPNHPHLKMYRRNLKVVKILNHCLIS